MVAQDRRPTSEIIEDLMEKSSSFSFVQAVRLLLHNLSLVQQNEDHDISRKEILENYIRVRPELSLRFPGTDITGVEKLEEDPGQPYKGFS